MANIAPGLASLTARPPTPPKRNIGPGAAMVPDTVQLPQAALVTLLNTPEEPPSSSVEYFGSSSEKINKRVGFSPWTEYHKHPSSIGFNHGLDDHIRPLPASKDCRSAKSILKSKPDIRPTVPMDELMNLSQEGDLSNMLEATVRHLESSIRNSRLDAYSTLLGCLSAYGNLPEQKDLAGRLPDLVGFIRRDIWARQPDSEALDTQLATQALKLLIYFATTQGLSESLPEDFCALVLEEAILALEDRDMPKMMVTHYMQLLIQENFASQHLNSNRVNRLLVALGWVTTHVKGNRIIGQRLMLYRRILLHSKSAMVMHVESWVDHLISGMLSAFKEIRGRAVLFGLEASLSLGTIKSVSQPFADTLNRESPDGKKIVEFLATRLNLMASATDDGIWVPQIWSIVVLFLRGRRHQVEEWEHLKAWLLLIQKCFNSSNAQIKYQSNRAWTLFIFAVSLDSSTSSKMVKMLRQPILPQLERKNGLNKSQTAKSPKQVARSSYCTLLYYAFRPSATYAQLDQYWEEYICQMFPRNQYRGKDDINYFCQVLAGLFCSNEPKSWDENRARVNRLVGADELPCLDPKWVRLRAAEISKVFGDLFRDADWRSEKDTEAPIILAWRSFTQAIKQASSKEVKTSIETMTALAHILNNIKGFWQSSLAQRPTHEVSQIIEKFDCLIREAVIQFGFIPFCEKRLAHTMRNSYEAAETPSSRSDKHQGPLISPILVLLGLLIRSIDHSNTEHNYSDAVKHLIEVAMRPATSRHTQLAVLRDLANLVTSEHDADGGTKLLVWRLIADAATRALGLAKFCDPLEESPQSLGHEYRDAVKILEAAILLRPRQAIKEWHDLATVIVQVLSKEICSDAVILVITEPLAKSITNLPTCECNEFLLGVGDLLLKNIQWPQSRIAVERARKSLWGVSHVTPKANIIDPSDHLYAITNHLLNLSYSSFKVEFSDTVESFLLEVADFIAKCPVSDVATLLKSIQQGVGVWIQDRNGVLTVSDANQDSANVYTAVTNLWAATTTAIESLPSIDSRLLSIIETLILSSLKSRHKALLNQSILLWNRTFGSLDELEYPIALKSVLLRLRTLTELELPNFMVDEDTEMSSPIVFLNSQPDEDIQKPEYSAPSNPAFYIGLYRKASPEPLKQPASDSRRSPWSSTKNPEVKTTPKARLRHDDSQIQFAAIDSSPLQPNELESQMLTDRQKEVRQRQILEASTMFSNLGHVPQSTDHVPNGTMSRLHFAENDMPSSPIHTGDEVTSSPAQDELADFIGSSPTPRSRNGRFRRRPEVQKPSQSPVVQVSSSFDIPIPSGSDAPAEPQAETREKEDDADISGCDMPMLNNDSFSSLSEHVVQTLHSEPHTPTRKLVSVKEPTQETVDSSSHCDNQVLIDAPPGFPQPSDDVAHAPVSEIVPALITPTPVTRSYNDGVTGDAHQGPATLMMHSETPETSQDPHIFARVPYTPNEDEQIAAQLVNDLERASSQAESERRGSLTWTSSPRVDFKRKRAPDDSAEDSESERKKKKSRVQPSRKRQNVQVVVDSRRTGAAGAENADIRSDDLPAASTPHTELKKVGLPAQTAHDTKGRRKKTAPVQHEPGRGARSSSISVSTECDSCGTSNATRQSIGKRNRVDYVPAGGRRRSARLRGLPGRSPALHVSNTARTSSDEFGEFSGADVLEGISIQVEQARADQPMAPQQNSDTRPELHEMDSSNGNIDAAAATSKPEILVRVKESDDVPEEGNEVQAQEILQSFRKLLDNIKRVTLGVEEEREIVSVLVDSVREVHEAGRRHGRTAPEGENESR